MGTRLNLSKSSSMEQRTDSLKVNFVLAANILKIHFTKGHHSDRIIWTPNTSWMFFFFSFSNQPIGQKGRFCSTGPLSKSKWNCGEVKSMRD